MILSDKDINHVIILCDTFRLGHQCANLLTYDFINGILLMLIYKSMISVGLYAACLITKLRLDNIKLKLKLEENAIKLELNEN